MIIAIFLIIINVQMNSKVDQTYLEYNFNNYHMKILKPIWWNDTILEEEVTLENDHALVSNIAYPKEWHKHFKLHFYYGQLKNQPPYKLYQLAMSNEDFEVALEVNLSIIDYLLLDQPNQNLTKIYKDIGDCFHEVGKIDLAIKNYQNAIKAKIGTNYYADEAQKNVDRLMQVQNKDQYARRLLSFKKNIIERGREFDRDLELLSQKKIQLANFMSLEDPEKLTSFQMAFLEFIYEDGKSTDPQILTKELIQNVTKQFQEYNETDQLAFKIQPSQLNYPTVSSNKWTLHFDGNNFEIVSVAFNRLEVVDISLSD